MAKAPAVFLKEEAAQITLEADGVSTSTGLECAAMCGATA